MEEYRFNIPSFFSWTIQIQIRIRFALQGGAQGETHALKFSLWRE